MLLGINSIAINFRWLSGLHHMADIHEWLISHGDEGCYECHHHSLEEPSFLVMDKKLHSKFELSLSEFQVTQFSNYTLITEIELPAVSFSHSF